RADATVTPTAKIQPKGDAAVLIPPPAIPSRSECHMSIPPQSARERYLFRRSPRNVVAVRSSHRHGPIMTCFTGRSTENADGRGNPAKFAETKTTRVAPQGGLAASLCTRRMSPIAHHQHMPSAAADPFAVLGLPQRFDIGVAQVLAAHLGRAAAARRQESPEFATQNPVRASSASPAAHAQGGTWQ